MTAGSAYSVVSDFAPTHAITDVSVGRPEVGVMVDANAGQVPTMARRLATSGIHVSFAMDHASGQSLLSAIAHGDEAVPRLGDGGLVSWLGTRGDLRRLVRELDWGSHFLYASSGPSLGQWLFAHSAGGKLVGGAVRLTDADDHVRRVQAGEVIELRADSVDEAIRQLKVLHAQLVRDHLRPVPVGRLLKDSGQQV